MEQNYSDKRVFLLRLLYYLAVAFSRWIFILMMYYREI